MKDLILIDQEIILKRLEKLNQYVQFLNELLKQPKSQFVSDPFVHGNAERYLQLAIQACMDIGNHILSNIKSKTPEEYRDIFIFMGENKIISEELADKMAPLAGLRNILVHDYLDINLDKIYLLLKNNLSDFNQLGNEISKYVLK